MIFERPLSPTKGTGGLEENIEALPRLASTPSRRRPARIRRGCPRLAGWLAFT